MTAVRTGSGRGRVVRWDSDEDAGGVVVDSLPGEVVVPPGLRGGAGSRDLQPGELVEVSWENLPGGGFRATRVVPTDA